MTEIKIVEAAKILGRHHSHVAKMVRDGKLKAVKRGKTWYFDAEYIERIAATLPTSREASRAALVNGRQAKPVTDLEIARKHVIEDRSWKRTAVKGAPKTDEMDAAIAKRADAQAAMLARIAELRAKANV